MQRGLVIIFLIVSFISLSARADFWILKIGEDRRIAMPGNHKIWVQDKKILSLKPAGAFLVVSGQSEGVTNLQVGEKTYRIQVVQPTKKTLLARFEKETKSLLGLKVKIKNHQVTITGKLFLWKDWQRLATVSEELGTPYVMSAVIPESLQQEALRFWQNEFSRRGLPNVPILFGRTLQARILNSSAHYHKYKELLEPFGVILEKDAQALELAPIVKVEITVAEVRRDFALNYGLRWPTNYSATVLSKHQTEFSELVFDAKAFEQQGRGKILASPNLICRSGKEAEFLAGGEFPIKIATYKMQDIVWKKYGVLLKVKPLADNSGRMSIALEIEVSTIDGARTVDGIPGLLTNKISSHFDLTRTQTIALSGLIKNEESKSTEGLPLLSRLPVLGALFSSRDFKENRTELVIFVRPSILQENTPQERRHLGDLNAG